MTEIERVMQDKSLTLQSKAIYIYFLQTSNGKKSFKLKSPEKIQNDLNIGKCAYYTHLHKLEDSGYLKIVHTRDEKYRFNGAKCILRGEKSNGKA